MVIHPDDLGYRVHIQYDRPVRLTMGDFLKVYWTDIRTIAVSDNMTGIPTEPLMTFGKHEPRYSYFSENKEFTQVLNASAMTPFTDDMVIRYELLSK
jgi:hypothetical protein